MTPTKLREVLTSASGSCLGLHRWAKADEGLRWAVPRPGGSALANAQPGHWWQVPVTQRADNVLEMTARCHPLEPKVPWQLGVSHPHLLCHNHEWRLLSSTVGSDAWGVSRWREKDCWLVWVVSLRPKLLLLLVGFLKFIFILTLLAGQHVVLDKEPKLVHVLVSWNTGLVPA